MPAPQKREEEESAVTDESVPIESSLAFFESQISINNQKVKRQNNKFPSNKGRKPLTPNKKNKSKPANELAPVGTSRIE